MVQRRIPFMSLLVLLLGGVMSVGGAPAPGKPTRDEGEKKSTGIVVTLAFAGDTKAAEVIKTLDTLKSMRCKETYLRRLKDGERPTATIAAPSTASSREVADVVKVLLDHHLKVITVEVKK